MTSAFFKSVRIYRLPDGSIDGDLEKALSKHRFRPVANHEASSIGWVPVDSDYDAYGLLYQVGDDDVCMLRLRTESRVLPGAVIKKELDERARKIEHEQGFMPGRKQMRELREAIIDDFLPQSFTTYTHTRVLIDPDNKLLLIEATSDIRCDTVIAMLLRTFDGLSIAPVQTREGSARAMNEWALGEEPSGFTIDNAAKFGAPASQFGLVSYKNVTPTDDAKRNIKNGRNCTQLAMTWADRLSFTLDTRFNLRSIKPLDVLRQDDHFANDAREQFQSDAFLFATDMAQMIDHLFDAMGGIAQDDDPVAGL